MNAFISEVMLDTLDDLQKVRSYDFERAYYEAFKGISGLRPSREAAAAEIIEGRRLAFQVWRNLSVVDQRVRGTVQR